VRILALPQVAIVVLLTVVILGDVSDYRTATATTDSVSVALAVQDLVNELQLERGLTSGLLAGDVAFRPEIDPERKKVDTELSELAGSTGAVRAVVAKLDGLDTLRVQVDTGKTTGAVAFQTYTGWIGLLNGVDYGFDRSADRALRRSVTELSLIAQAREDLSQERAFLNGVFTVGGFKAGEYAQFVAMYEAGQAARNQFVQIATPAQLAAATAVGSSGAYSEAADFESRALASADGKPLLADPQSWWSALTTVLDGSLALEHLLGNDITDRAQVLRDAATLRLAVVAGLVVLCLVGAVALVVSAARSITGPLAAMAAEADAVASRRLPDAVTRVQTGSEADQPEPPPPVRVPKRSSAEIYGVAEALDRLQSTAFSLATEQALIRRNTTESLANLGRRNQNLLRRQLSFITRLESEESDPSGLANLFELDHLATRMRRNAESVLVLVGESSPRRWSAPMPVADVIRAAISEVEEYRRVALRRIDDGYVAGGYVTGLAHMVAELVENGLTFSPPDVDVEIQGRMMGTEYLIAITDQGVGMDPEELARANARLRGEEHFLMAPARYLGHYVVGQLAREMSVGVELSPSPVTGVTARVTLPVGVLANSTAIEQAGQAPTQVTPMIAPALTGEPVRTVPAALRSAPPVARPGPRAVPPAPARVTAQLAIGVRSTAQIVEYITVPDPDAAPGSPPADGEERTRNGLRKRPQRNRPGQGPPAGPGGSGPGTDRDQRPATDGAQRPAVIDESPEQLRARLLSLRAGVHRGQSEGAGKEGSER
jgi:signal transduction histidine kinase